MTGPTFEGHFVEAQVVGETARSWLVCRAYDGRPVKTNKPTKYPKGTGGLVSRNGPRALWTDDQRANEIWLHDHKGHVLRLIERADPLFVAKVAADLGYQPAVAYLAEVKARAEAGKDEDK